MKKIKQTKFTKEFIISGLFLLLAACGNPRSGDLNSYSKLKRQLGPIHPGTTKLQEYFGSDLYRIDFDQAPTFVVGQKNTLRFQTSLNISGTKYRLISGDRPKGSEPLKDLGQGVYEFSWTPDPSLIPENKSSETTGGFHVALDIYEVTNPQVRGAVESLATETLVKYRLVLPNTSPEILSISGIATYPQITKVKQGDILPIEITVKDPSSTPTNKPFLARNTMADKITGEQCIFDAYQYILLYNEFDPTPAGPGIWKFKGSFDTVNNSLKKCVLKGTSKPTSTAQANATFKIVGANGIHSSSKTISFEIAYKEDKLSPSTTASDSGTTNPSPAIPASPAPISAPQTKSKASATPSSKSRPVAKPSAKAKPSPSPAATPSPSPTATPSPSPTATPSPSPTATPSPSPTATPSPSPTAVPTGVPTSTKAPSKVTHHTSSKASGNAKPKQSTKTNKGVK